MVEQINYRGFNLLKSLILAFAILHFCAIAIFHHKILHMKLLLVIVTMIGALQVNAQKASKMGGAIQTIKSTSKTMGKTTSSATTGSKSNSTASFTETEAASAIKDALLNGITTGVTKAAAPDGYFKNAFIKVLMPPQAKAMESTLRQIGAGALVDNIILTMNRAAEKAAPQAKNIFINSVSQMTINDAISIVSNQQQDTATKFLERTTTEQLVAAFKPSIKTALDQTLATRYWSQAMTQYNRIPFVSKVNTDLPDYVTRKGISGLFYLIAQEEARIRKDPVARTTDILEKVFGNLKF